MEKTKAYISYLKKIRNLTPGTLRIYSQSVRDLEKWCNEHSCSIDNLDTNNARSYIISLREKLSPRTINQRTSAIRSFYRFLQLSSPFIDSAMKYTHRQRQYISFHVLEQILSESVDDTFSAIFSLLIYCGLRANEIVCLHRDDVNIEEQYIVINGKGRKQRILPLLQKSIPYLRAYEQNPDTNQNRVFFFERYNLPLSSHNLRDIVAEYTRGYIDAEAAHPHVIRHSFATHLSKEGIPLKAISRWLGHASVRTTEIYLHLSFEELAKHAEACNI